MNKDPGECEVWCVQCNAYLFSVSRHETGREAVMQGCPYKCKTDANGHLVMESPPKNGAGKYGRS